MTIQEAINIMSNYVAPINDIHPDYYDEIYSAISMSIQALKFQLEANDTRKETAEAILDYFDKYANTGKYLIGNMIRNQKEKYGIE